MYMTLPLPASARTVCFVVVPSDGSAPPTTYGVQVPKAARVSDALALLGAQVCVTGISGTSYTDMLPFSGCVLCAASFDAPYQECFNRSHGLSPEPHSTRQPK
jgi:hypothetical protein